MKPSILAHQDIEALQKDHPELEIIDHIDLALEELFDIESPSKKDSKTREEIDEYGRLVTAGLPNEWGNWVYFPWLNKVVHMPPRDELRALRTSRNRNLVTSEEQQVLYAATVLVAGMSVGSNIVEALVSQGIGGKLVLMDMDIIEPSNLNRIRSPYHHVGLHKIEAISRKVWEIDPYIEIESYEDGLSEVNLQSTLIGNKIDVIVDEMDDLRMKILVRETAQKHRIAVVMAADDGDDSLIDIERYDLQDDLRLFDGRVPEGVIVRIKSENIPRAELGMMIGRYFVGTENIPLRMYRSLAEVGKSLPSWPQLGGAAALSGVAVAYAAKRILLNQSLQSGRTLISIEDKLAPDTLSEAERQELERYRQFMKGQG